LQANVFTKAISTPKMPTEISSRKLVQIGNLWANCENSYFDFTVKEKQTKISGVNTIFKVPINN